MYQVCYWHVGLGPWKRFIRGDYPALSIEFSTVDEAVTVMKDRMKGLASYPVAVFEAGDNTEPLVIVHQPAYPMPVDQNPEVPRIYHSDGFIYREHDASNVRLEATSPFGEYDGPVSEAEAGRYYFAGPDVYRRRNFYGQIVVAEDGSITVT